MFVGLTAEKQVGDLFAGGQNLFKTFLKVRYTLSGSFHWGEFLS